MNIHIEAAHVRRVLLADGWHAVEDTDGGSSFQAGSLAMHSGGQAVDTGEQGFSFVDHHTRKRLAGPLSSIRALELD
jgi:hypothetical protein